LEENKYAIFKTGREIYFIRTAVTEDAKLKKGRESKIETDNLTQLVLQ
jgi:hypothetical protein